MKNFDWKFYGALIAAGIAWGTLTMQVRSTQDMLSNMRSHIERIDTYLIHSSNGKFAPGDPKAGDP